MDSIIADIVITIAALTLLVTIGLTTYSVWHSQRMNKRQKYENGVPIRAITFGTAALTLTVALITLLVGGVIDMLIITTATLLTVAVGLVVCGRIRSLSRGRLHK